MTTTRESAAPKSDDDDEKSSRDRARDFVKTGTDAAVELFGGVADAFGSALRKAGKEVDKEDVTRIGFRNGLLRGFAEGAAHFFEKMPDVVRNTYDVLQSSSDDDKEKPAKKLKSR